MKNTPANKNKNFRVREWMIGVAVAVILPHPDVTAQQAPLNLLSTSRFAILAASAITDVPASAITGDVGLSPAARTYIDE